jgi:hypothetical protein
METTHQNSTKSAISVDTVLGTWLSRSIMEATGRFEFINGNDEIMIFWDNCWEQEKTISSKWTLGKLMQWITNFYSEDFLWQGEQKAQRKMRTALGLD